MTECGNVRTVREVTGSRGVIPRSEEAAGAGETRSHTVLVTAALGPVQRNMALSSAGRNTVLNNVAL